MRLSNLLCCNLALNKQHSETEHGISKVERQEDLNRFIDTAHLVIDADTQRESMCVFEIDLVSQSLTDLSSSGGRVQMETQSTAITQIHRHIYRLLGLGSLSAGRRKVRMKFF